MIIRGAQWNIQAARVRSPESNPLDFGSYVGDNPEYFAQVIEELKPSIDFLTLQEVHANESRDQAIEIASSLGLDHVITHGYGPSFMDGNYQISQSIVSKHPIVSSDFFPFKKPGFKVSNPDQLNGEYVEKGSGLSVAKINVGQTALNLATAHMLPFQLFNVDPYEDRAKALRVSVKNAIDNLNSPWIVQGDFNIDGPSIGSYINRVPISGNGYMEVAHKKATVPAGLRIDHVATQGLRIVRSETISIVLSDHYLLITDFQVAN